MASLIGLVSFAVNSFVEYSFFAVDIFFKGFAAYLIDFYTPLFLLE